MSGLICVSDNENIEPGSDTTPKSGGESELVEIEFLSAWKLTM